MHDGMGSLRALVIMARQGLAVLRRPVPALGAALFQCVGWLMQLFAVWAVMEAFNLDLPLPAAGLVLVLMNVAIIFPLWPGQHRAAAGRGRAAARPVRRPLRHRLRVRARAAGGRDVGRRRRRAHLPRPRGALARLAEDDGGAAGGGRDRARRAGASEDAEPSEPSAEQRAERAEPLGDELARRTRCAGPWPVTAATKMSRSSVTSSTSVTAVTVAVRGTSRRSAISPNASPRAEACGRGSRPRRSRSRRSGRRSRPRVTIASPARASTARRRWRGTRAPARAGRRAAARHAAAPCARGAPSSGRSQRRRRPTRSVAAGSRMPATSSDRLRAEERDAERRDEPAEPDRAEQDALEHAEHAAEHVIRDDPLEQRQRGDVGDRVPEPDDGEREQRDRVAGEDADHRRTARRTARRRSRSRPPAGRASRARAPRTRRRSRRSRAPRSR